MTPQLVDVIDVLTATRTYSSGTVRHLTSCDAEPWGLRVACPTPEDPSYDSEVGWLLPADDLRLTIRRPRSRHAADDASVLTAVRVWRDGRHWRTADLLLGLTVRVGSPCRIAGSEEFAAAVAGRVLRPGDADLALHTVHRTQAELAHHRNDLVGWLAARGIMHRWPPFG